jgi:peptidoglycan/xylan/chitin deacetylase (PgdA/CDA1 family)
MQLGRMTDFLKEGKTPRRGVALTFDDGYADNYDVARPLLETHDIPATFFLVGDWIGLDNAYWWDELADILLRPGQIPETFEVILGGKRYEHHLGPAATYTDADRRADCDTRVWAAKRGSRLSFYYFIWKLLRTLPQGERAKTLTEIRSWADAPGRAIDLPVAITKDQVHRLAAEGLIEVGSHAQSHACLSNLDPSRQRQEMTNSKVTLEAIVERPVQSFAYPYGDYSRETPRLLKEEGYARACTIAPGQIRPGEDLFLLPRFHVSNWDGDQFASRFFRLFP